MSLTTLTLPPAVGPDGEAEALVYRLRLIGSDGNRIAGIHTGTGAPVAGLKQGQVLATAAEPAALPLIPQGEIATADAAPTWWELRLRPGTVGDVDTWLLSVPASDVPLSLLDLIAAQAAPPDQASAMLARIAALESNQLPAGTDGDILIHKDGTWTATDELPLN
jgi:hypothetical protein